MGRLWVYLREVCLGYARTVPDHATCSTRTNGYDIIFLIISFLGYPIFPEGRGARRVARQDQSPAYLEINDQKRINHHMSISWSDKSPANRIKGEPMTANSPNLAKSKRMYVQHAAYAKRHPTPYWSLLYSLHLGWSEEFQIRWSTKRKQETSDTRIALRYNRCVSSYASLQHTPRQPMIIQYPDTRYS